MVQQPPSFPPQADPLASGALASSSAPSSARVTVPGYPSGPAAPAEEGPGTGPLPSREALRREARVASSRRGAGDADVERAGALLKSVADIFSQRVVGQEQLRTALVTSLMSSGHILLESVPGLAKTTAAQTLASAVSGSFRRIQCTPDLMPNDIVGTQILNSSTGEMTTQLGPVHANIVLLDEINRSSAKTQSAMLEAMQERQTSIGGVVYPLPHPFMVLATQNPIEEEGTYVLPEAQMDRFLMKEVLSYPKPAEEADVLDRISSGSFHRIQCTPDLMPNDIVGTQVLNYATGEMTTQLGPVHANIVLLDEINRSSAKTQSAMLEAMQERQTSIGGVVYPLPEPFMVLATQNPIEEEGTYVLPEAQMDRFLMKEVLTYPKPVEEADVLDRISSGAFEEAITTQPISTDDVEWLQGAVERVYVDPVIRQYIVALVNTSRGGGPRPVPGLDKHVRVGASPRGGIALMKIAQAVALQADRTYVTPDDVGLLRHAVLRHRLVLTYDALADDIAPEAIIDAIFAAVPTP